MDVSFTDVRRRFKKLFKKFMNMRLSQNSVYDIKFWDSLFYGEEETSNVPVLGMYIINFDCKENPNVLI